MSFRPPKYRMHKGSGQALVQINGKRVYLGKYGSEKSQEKYHRLVAEFLAAGKEPKSPDADRSTAAPVTVNELILAFWEHAKQRYVKNGVSTSEIHSFRTALHPVRRLYGGEPAINFGPLALVACREKLVEAGICRKRINQHVGRIRKMFKWGVAREMVPEGAWRALCAVEGLRFGEAPERPPVKPVPEAFIGAIKPFVSPQVWAMINLQLWSACRPGEACIIRSADISMSGSIWEYRPHSHKVEHHGKERVIYLGPQAQEVIRPWLKTDLEAYLFSPREARALFQAQRAKNRKTPLPRRPHASQRKARPKRAPGEHYTDSSYDHAIRRACQRAGVPHWNPHRLRHNAATRIRAAYGVEIARIILGVSSIPVCEIYAEFDRQKAHEIAAKVG